MTTDAGAASADVAKPSAEGAGMDDVGIEHGWSQKSCATEKFCGQTRTYVPGFVPPP